MKNVSGLPEKNVLLRHGLLRVQGAKNTRASLRSLPGRVRSLLCRGEEGQSLVELALVLPMLVIVLTGMVSFSLALYNYQQLGMATANVAQLLGSMQSGDPCSKAVTSMTTLLPSWTATKFTYTVTITDANDVAHKFGPISPTAASPFSCTAGSSELAAGKSITVQASYQYTWFPILSFSPSGNLVATQTVIGQ